MSPKGLRVGELWRFPVKSMQGERLEVADLDERGLRGDRQWALLDLDTGLTLTARRVPELLFASARLVDDDTVEIELPDGAVTTDAAALSDWLGRRVELRRANDAVAGTYEIALDAEHEDTATWVQWHGPTGTFHDSTRTRVSLASTATMGSWDRRRFRANVVLEAAAAGAEDVLVGHRVALGGAVLDVGKAIDRCVMTTRPQPGGIERDLDVLRTIARERANELGVGAMVVTGGRVATGDELIVS